MSLSSKKQALQAIKSILKSEKISHIYYIDDKFGDKGLKELFLGVMKDLKNSKERPKNISKFMGLPWDRPMTVFQKEVTTLWEKGEQKVLIHDILEFINGKDDANVIPVLYMETHFKDTISIYTPQQWVGSKDKVLESLTKDTRALCLFDFDFNNWRGPNGEKNGMDFVKQIIKKKKADVTYCAVFSHLCSIEEEDCYRIYLSNKYDIDSKYFCTISKKRYESDQKLSAFAEGVKNVVSLRYIECLKKISMCMLKKRFISSSKELNSLSPKTFNQIIQKSALAEGTWEIKELFRVFGIINNYQNYKELLISKNNIEFNNTISKIREIDIDTGYSYSHRDGKAVCLRNKEIFHSGDVINELHHPISNGDIFKIGSKKEFILLIQPCNVSIRRDGKRNYNFNKGHLIPVIKRSIEKINTLTQQILETTDNSTTQKYCADFPNFKFIELDILDLVVYNSSGDCKINMNEEECDNELIHSPWKLRYKKLFNLFDKHEKTVIAFNEICDSVDQKEYSNQIKGVSPYIKKPYCVKEFSIGDSGVYDTENRVFNFNIKRLKNYRNPYSIDLLQNFMNYLSRNAFDRDFSVRSE